MKRNFILILAVFITVLLVVNGTKRILSFRGTLEKVDEAQAKLDLLKRENEVLKNELEYKKSGRFAEEEIRNKLGLAKEGETVVVVPKEGDEQQKAGGEVGMEIPNWQKWRNLFLGRS